MITSSIKSQASTYTVTLDISGAPQIEAGSGPWPSEMFDVTGVRIDYADAEVDALAVLAGDETLSVALDDPKEWEPWLLELVDEHRPAAR